MKNGFLSMREVMLALTLAREPRDGNWSHTP